MRTRFTILLIFQTFITINIFAQNKYCNCNDSSALSSDFEVKLMGKAFVNKYPGKSIQFYKSWMPGNLLMSDSSIVNNKFLVYNSLLDELIWLRTADQKQVVLKKQTIAGFTLYGTDNVKVAEFKRLHLKNRSLADSTGTFLQILAEGKISLYAERKVTFESNTNEFHNKTQYYLQKGGNFYILIPNRWFLYQLMGEDKAKMKAIVRRKFLFIKKEPELIEAIQLFNETY
jgi:hypothetical protein